MERLRPKEIDTLFSYLPELYAHRDLEEFKSSVLRSLSDIVPWEFASYNERDLRSHTNVFIPEPTPPDLPEAEEALDTHVGENPIVNYYLQTRDGRALRISDFLTQREFRKLGLYNEYYRKVGIDHSLLVGLSITTSPMIAIGFGRNGRDFSERERLLLDTLRPHLIQAYQNAAAVERNRLESRSLRQAIEEIEGAVISLSQDGRPQMVTEKARRLLAEYFGPVERTEEFPEDLGRWVQHQRSLLSGGDDAPPPPGPLAVERGGGKLVVRLVSDDVEEGTCLLLLEEQAPPISAEDFTSLPELTRREGEILHLVARGKSDQQAASSLHVSPYTVGKHLQNVYRKLGVGGRAGAVSKALEASGRLRP